MANRSSDKATNRTIVHAFLQVAGIPISEEAICDAEPPSPDVLCTLPDGSRTALELTEAVDQEIAQNVKVSPASRAQMYEHYRNLPCAERTRLQEILGNAYIFVRAKNATTDRRFEQAVPRVFDLLLGCSRDTQGDLEQETLPTCIEAIYVTRGKWSCGPLFDRGTPALWVGEPIVEKIEKKSSKRYECDCPIELLVHSRTCPLAPDNFWKTDVHDFVTRNIGESLFCRVSVFDWIDSTVRYTYPERRL
jgi:hypothetical protein